MTESERDLLVLLARVVCGSLDTPYTVRQEVRALLDKMRSEAKGE